MENNATFQAPIFVDAGYEGDLRAQSGVDFTWGR
ncbi:MAG: FAD-dependent oxidoreductase [Chloracidobacterium sp.]|nr:FAD-dependent oxidoreductase [Chloracidobacterium sp.]